MKNSTTITTIMNDIVPYLITTIGDLCDGDDTVTCAALMTIVTKLIAEVSEISGIEKTRYCEYLTNYYKTGKMEP